MIELYLWTTPNGYKPAIALEEMGLTYSLHWVDIGKGEQFAPEFLKFSPNNRIPAIIDHEGPDGAPISVFESGAILQYLAEKTGQYYGKTPREKVAVDEWLMWQMGGVGPMFGQAYHFRNLDEKLDYPIKRYTDETLRLADVANRRLAEHEYFAGDYSIADMAIFPWIRGLDFLGQGTIAARPHLARWIDAVASRPAVEKAVGLAPTASDNSSSS